MAIIVDPPSKGPRPRSLRRIAYLSILTLIFISFVLGYGLYTPIQLRLSTKGYDNFPGAEFVFAHHASSAKLPSSNHTTTVVTGRLDEDPFQVDWIVHKLRDITSLAVYIVDDPGAPLHLERNHGRESMVYLRYILDHYDELNDVTFFVHAHRTAWHNNLLHREDNAVAVNMMNRSHVMKHGYVNLRCDAVPGCPRWIKFEPSFEESEEHDTRFANMFNTHLWNTIFPNVTRMPKFLSQPCCSQFAVSRDRLRSVPKAQYQRLVDWIEEDPIDGFTGRVMEYTWQYLFLGKEEYCPDVKTCYCEQYGMCMDDQGMIAAWQKKIAEMEGADLDMVSLRNEIKAHGGEGEGDPHVEEFRARIGKAEHERKQIEEKLIELYGVPPLLDVGFFG